jgi:putative sterol carrier protein
MAESDTVKLAGFQVSEVFEQMKLALSSLSTDEKEKLIKTAKGVYQFDLTNKEDKTASWVLELKTPNTMSIRRGTHEKPDVTLIWDDDGFVGMSTGKISAQKAFLQGKLKSKGNMMLATKLEPVMKQLIRPKSKM